MDDKIKPGATFSEQVDAVINGADASNSHIEVLKNTPELLKLEGLSDLPILMTAAHLHSITETEGEDNRNYHGLGTEIVKQLPKLLSEPVMIFDSLTRPDSIVVVTRKLDDQNRPVIVAIKVNGVGRQGNTFKSANILTSAYGKDNFLSFLKRNIAYGYVLYADSKRSQELSVNLGIQFPDVMANLSFDTIIRQAGAIVNFSKQKNFEEISNSKCKSEAFGGKQEESEERTKETEEREKYIPKDKANIRNDLTEEILPTKLPPIQESGQNASERKWFGIDLPEGSLGQQSGEDIIVMLPEGEYGPYIMSVPIKFIKTVDGKQQLNIASDFTYSLYIDGRLVELTGQELHDRFLEKQLGKKCKINISDSAYDKVFEELEKNVPEEMRELRNWCVYCAWQSEGEVIHSAVTGAVARQNSPNDWTDFNTAIKYAKKNGFEGVAFLLDGKSGITCIDLDECVLNAETGERKERAAKLIADLKGTYMERSTSGNGVRIFVKDNILQGGRYRSTSEDAQKGNIEVFDDQRIIAVTGNMLSETNTLTRAKSAATVYLRRELGEQIQRVVVAEQQPCPSGGERLNDSDLIRWIRKNKNARLPRSLATDSDEIASVGRSGGSNSNRGTQA